MLNSCSKLNYSVVLLCIKCKQNSSSNCATESVTQIARYFICKCMNMFCYYCLCRLQMPAYVWLNCNDRQSNSHAKLKTFKFIKAISDTVFVMINAEIMTSILFSSGLRFGRSSSPIISECKLLNTFELSKLFLTLYLT